MAITDLYLNTNNPDFCTLYSELLFSLLESDAESVVRIFSRPFISSDPPAPTQLLLLFQPYNFRFSRFEQASSSTASTSALCMKLNDLVSNPRDVSALSQLDFAMTKVFSSRTTTIVFNPSSSVSGKASRRFYLF
jgi:hypothetical protein